MHRKLHLTITAMISLVQGTVFSAFGVDEHVDFNRDVRPILSDKCFFCHGPDAHQRQAELRLDQEQSSQRDRGGYAVIVPGKISESEMMNRILSRDPDLIMPPADSHKHLNDDEVSILHRWIEQGAHYKEPWAYVAPVRVAIPKVKDAKWVRNWIDYFLLRN
ncbi:MAG: c-type cytochrome domain-containing protein, partial [Pirellulales bacterium]